MMSHSEMESLLLQYGVLIRSLQEQIAALRPRTGTTLMMDSPIMDQEHAGRLQDLAEHITKGWNKNMQLKRIGLRAQALYYMDPSGRVGRDWTIIVTPANATDKEIEDGTADLAVSGYVP